MTTETGKRFSNLTNSYPSFQDGDPLMLSGYKWMNTRRNDDRAEGLWRVHDKLYALDDFIAKHPGGPQWLQLTKGTDITESFEVHHIYTAKVEKVLSQFYVRDAQEPRNVKLTFHDSGFYRTLKRRVGEKLLTVDRQPEWHTKLTIDGLLAATFALLFVAVRLQSYTCLLLPALAATYTVIAAHNFFHRRDNFRMLYFNLTLLSYREWRISHAMSHHLFPNSLLDLEVTLFEPFLCWVTNANTKNLVQRYASWLYGPLMYCLLFFDQFVKRAVFSLKDGQSLFYLSDAVPLALPVFMYTVAASGTTLGTVLQQWAVLVIMASFLFGLIGLNAGHHNTFSVHDGDELRADLDWGLYSLDTIVDNSDIKSPLLAITHFGHHALHHLLPTIDHGLIPQLYPVVYETMREFDTDLKEFPWSFHLAGQLKQLARVQPTDYGQRVRMRMEYLRGAI